MTRYNIFFPIHNGLRAMLYETALQLQQTSFDDAEEAGEAVKTVRSVLVLFQQHAHTEDNHVLPALAAYEPSVVATFESEHDEDNELGERLQALFIKLQTATSTPIQQSIGEELSRAFARFVAFNLTHMAKEEEAINRLLWQYYTDAELHAITQKIISNISPLQMAEYGKWMIRGLSNSEITGWLKEVEHSMPQPVFQMLLTIAEEELHPRRWRLVQESLTEGVMIA